MVSHFFTSSQFRPLDPAGNGHGAFRGRTRRRIDPTSPLRRIAVNLIVNLIKRFPRKKISQRQRRILAARDTDYLRELLGF